MSGAQQPLRSVTAYELKLAWPLGAFFIVFFSVIVDVFYAYLDPRIRPT